jgi:hypothetical protein
MQKVAVSVLAMLLVVDALLAADPASYASGARAKGRENRTETATQ